MSGKANSTAAHAVTAMPRSRRAATSLATGMAVVLALVCGWHAFFGQNGITAYAQKRSEDRALQKEIGKLADENSRLKDHVDHLQADPDAIEMEARERLHYTRTGEVIYTLNPPRAASKAEDASPSQTR